MTAGQLRARVDRLVARHPKHELQQIVFVSVEAAHDEAGRILSPRMVGLCRAIHGVDPRDRVEEISRSTIAG
jgi:hypothetical protein